MQAMGAVAAVLAQVADGARSRAGALALVAIAATVAVTVVVVMGALYAVRYRRHVVEPALAKGRGRRWRRHLPDPWRQAGARLQADGEDDGIGGAAGGGGPGGPRGDGEGFEPDGDRAGEGGRA